MSDHTQLPTDVQQKLDKLLTQRQNTLEAIEKIKLEKEAYIKDMEGFKVLFVSAKTPQAQETALSSAKNRYNSFIERIKYLKSS